MVGVGEAVSQQVQYTVLSNNPCVSYVVDR